MELVAVELPDQGGDLLGRIAAVEDRVVLVPFLTATADQEAQVDVLDAQSVEPA